MVWTSLLRLYLAKLHANGGCFHSIVHGCALQVANVLAAIGARLPAGCDHIPARISERVHFFGVAVPRRIEQCPSTNCHRVFRCISGGAEAWRFQAGVAAAILAAYACVVAFVPAPGVPAGSYVLNHNLVHSVDIAVLGQYHWDIWPYRDEGWGTVLVVIPAIATTLVGLLIGELLMISRSLSYKAKVIAAMGVGLLALGFGISPWIPIEMKMWTTSYGLASAGVACLEFLFFLWIVDIVRLRKWTIVFVPFGRNAIFIYMLTSLISIKAGTDVFTSPLAAHLGKSADLFQAAAALAVEWLILFWMMRRKIYVRP